MTTQTAFTDLVHFAPADEDGKAYAACLSEMIRHKTVSWKVEEDSQRFDQFHHFLHCRFPVIFQQLELMPLTENVLSLRPIKITFWGAGF